MNFTGPNLISFEKWLHERIHATQNPYLRRAANKWGHQIREKGNHIRTKAISIPPKGLCEICKERYRFCKYQKYENSTLQEKFAQVKGNELCYNCLKNYSTNKCKSRNTCFEKDCKDKHHTSLHKHFKQLKKLKERKAKQNRDNTANIKSNNTKAD